MNWGKGVAIALGSFMIFIIVLVVKLMSSNVDLVSEDYYQKEINYSQEMDAVQNSENLDQKVLLNITDTYVAIKIPENKDIQNVEVKLIRSNNEKLDRLYKVENTNTFLIDKSELEAGNYNTEIHYTIKGEKYLQKDTITV
ncbi:MAG: FixH family protein [Crocinitomicaceae bacterium]